MGALRRGRLGDCLEEVKERAVAGGRDRADSKRQCLRVSGPEVVGVEERRGVGDGSPRGGIELGCYRISLAAVVRTQLKGEGPGGSRAGRGMAGCGEGGAGVQSV